MSDKNPKSDLKAYRCHKCNKVLFEAKAKGGSVTIIKICENSKCKTRNAIEVN